MRLVSRPLSRPHLLAATLALAFGGMATWHSPAHAQAAEAESQLVDIQLPAQPLPAALNELSRQAGVAVFAAGELPAGLFSRPVAGRMTAAQALGRLLAGTGLEATRTSAGGYAIRRSAVATSAATPAAEATLPLVTARAQADSESAGYVARRATVGSKTDAPLLEIPQSISVITSQELEDKGITTLTDALAQTPGVTVNPYGFDSRAPDWVVLRGFDGWYTSSYRDGLVQNVGLTFLGVQTEVYGLERLEVLRGPSSVLFGKGDVGGVVNRVSKLPSADAVREIAVQLGSHERRQLAADLGGALDDEGRLRYRLVGLVLDTGTQEQYPSGERMGQKRRYLAPSLRWQLSPATSLTLQAESLRDDASDDVQFVTGADGLPTNVKEGDPRYSRIVTGSDATGYQLEHALAGGWTLRQKLRQARRTMDKHHILSWLASDGATLQRQARHDVESVNETSIDTSLQGQLRTGAVAHTLLFGLDWDRSRAQWRRAQDMTSPLDMAHPVYGVSIAEPTTAVADTRFTSTQLGLYAQDLLKLDTHWGLTLGLRHDRVKSHNNDRFYAARTVQSDQATTGRVGVNYLVGNGWSPYASYAESFVPNIGTDAAGASFQPSRGRQLELGIKYLPDGAPVSFTAALFNLEKTDVLSYDPLSFEARQIGKLRSRGLELEAKAALTRQLRLTASFTALDMKVLASANSAEVGKMPILTPRQTGALWLDYAVAGDSLRGLGLGAGLRYVGKRWNDDGANTPSEPAYTLVDAAIHYDTGPWRVALHVTNLFDKAYYSGQAYGSYFRGAERNLVASAKYRF